MKLLIYGINYSPELTGIGKYSGEMARWFAEQGHGVRVITAPPYYPDWKIGKGHSAWRFEKRVEGGVEVYRCPLYVPAKPSAFKRMLHLASFSLSSACALLSQLWWKPDVVVLVAPTLFCAPQALLLGKLTRAQTVLHIQDFEVDALFGLGLAQSGRLKRIAFAAERAIMRGFDKVSTISSGMLERAASKGVDADRLMFFPNWAEVARFQDIRRSGPLLDRLGVEPTKRVLLYSGNIGEKQGLEVVIQAAQRLAAQRDLVFLIVGEGAGKARLVEQVERLGLSNVLFAPLQPYDDLPALLASADCHLVIQKRGAADAVLPSKLTNILAVGGNAVITADPETTLGLLCAEYPGIATCIEPESVDALIQGIEDCLAMPSPNRIARFYAEENLEKERILSRFIDEITQLPMATPTAAPVSAAMQTTNTSADRLQNLLRAVAEQTNILALDVALSEALDERARTGLVKDIAELSRLIQQTAGEAQVKMIDPSEAWMAVEQIRPLIGRILLQLELAGPERALPNDLGTVVPFKQRAVDSEGLSALARDLDAMTVGETR
ncbi:glycosyltransferase WbuB [Stutzerimonas chloritidismutans]|uniref:glycosyltransferase WbuB n=1 Tax=Stutzerimonas chloritidismutans TaxID=203192 RepID=UPI0030DFE408